MSTVCSRCHAELPDDARPHKSGLCDRCGQSADQEAAPALPPESDSRFPVWKILPWAAVAGAALIFLPHLMPHKTLASGTVPAAAASTPSVSDPSANASASAQLPSAALAATPQAASVPLTVTLFSAARGRHIPEGAPVMISAYAALAPGDSASIAVSYTRDGGPKSLLSLTQGSLASTAWTPAAPGHYRFTASAVGSRKTSAVSPHLSVWVDAPAPPPAVPEPPHRAELAAAPRHRPHPVPAASHAPQPYHVAAASFPVRHIADTLAGALSRRGFHTFVRSGVARSGRRTYTVETGDYLRHADAQKQVRLLQRDGYPAFVYHVPP